MARRSIRIQGVLLCSGLLLLGGCGTSAAVEAQRAALAAEQEVRLRKLEDLEVRLVTVAARQRAWSELQARHERISAIACENAASHAAAMEAHEARQREKFRAQRARRRAVRAELEREGPPKGIRTAAVEGNTGSN